ncbi:MAG: hypothetical protein HKO66_05520 [Saprospiraceae bacterium]|nr:hypothetical protein [Bacteroidia bacterium]NNE14219.1 hypothetical protein [Saprospiraceae bacterium]NNL91668.1 hypothetical protein [Saprospiraceae bacterium]
MAQLNWTYFSLTGFPYRIEMYHGDESGHLILFVNSNIIHIDFKQFGPTDYSFYIENQLLKLEIKGDLNPFDYVLTPQPIPRNAENEEKTFDEHFWIPLIVLIIAANLIFFVLN